MFATPVVLEDGSVDGVVIRVDDVTEREKMIKELQEAKHQAEQSDKLNIWSSRLPGATININTTKRRKRSKKKLSVLSSSCRFVLPGRSLCIRARGLRSAVSWWI